MLKRETQLHTRRRSPRLFSALHSAKVRSWFVGLSSLLTILAIILAVPDAQGQANSTAKSNFLYEGWSKVLMQGQHVGYLVQRYEFDSKKKQYKSISFLKTEADGHKFTESLVSTADASLKPVSYQYTSIVGPKTITIDATFTSGAAGKAQSMTAILNENGKKTTIRNTLPKGAFLSSFLGYVMLMGEQGIKKGVKYAYEAVAEEDAGIYKGEAFIASEESVEGIATFKVLNTFKGARFVSLITHKAEVLGTESPAQGISTALVGTMSEAIGSHALNTSTLNSLFGSVPKGESLSLIRIAAGSKSPTSPPATNTNAPPEATKSSTTPKPAPPTTPAADTPSKSTKSP
ncbi:MAG TPA: hypothetical protein PLZ57_00415 [Pseudobdellovibrionaceae bacterium]|nr:hypothetical protein [Pseudobdellovibrionaceae bacterium]